jgi:ABC-type multidrug transport system ATPase subunit
VAANPLRANASVAAARICSRRSALGNRRFSSTTTTRLPAFVDFRMYFAFPRGGLRALGNLTMTIPGGSVCRLLGPNGAATLLRPDGGSVRVAGFDPVREPARERERIGPAGQFAAIDDHLTGREIIVMTGRLYGLSRPEATRRAAGIVDRIHLAGAAEATNGTRR